MLGGGTWSGSGIYFMHDVYQEIDSAITDRDNRSAEVGLFCENNYQPWIPTQWPMIQNRNNI